MGVYLVHHPLRNFSPEVGGGRLHGNGRLQGTLQYICVSAGFPQVEGSIPFHGDKQACGVKSSD